MVVVEKFIAFFKINWPIMINIAGMLLAAMYQSRAFIVGFLASMCFIWLLKKKGSRRTKLKTALLMLLTSSALIAFLSYCFKRDSSAGRILIYNISWSMIKDHWLFGTGYGTFGYAYLNYQADYFKRGHYTVKELLLADNTKHAFNDYLQWVIETGLPGLLLLFAVLWFIIYILKKAIVAQINYSAVLLTAISLIVAIATAALFTHVFELLYFQLAFFWSVFTVWSYAYVKLRKWIATTGIIISLFVICTYDGHSEAIDHYVPE